jgi:hypothetical protein
MKGREHLIDMGINGTLKLKWVLQKHDVMMWTRFIWFRIGARGALLLWNIKFHLLHRHL